MAQPKVTRIEVTERPPADPTGTLAPPSPDAMTWTQVGARPVVTCAHDHRHVCAACLPDYLQTHYARVHTDQGIFAVEPIPGSDYPQMPYDDLFKGA